MNLRILVPAALIAVGAGLYGLSGRILTSTVPQSGDILHDVSEQEEIKTVRIWTVKQDLLPGQRISNEHLQANMVPYSEARMHGLTENEEGIIPDISIAMVDGMVAGEQLVTGQWVTSADFVTPKQSRYIELIISENMVPYAIPIDPDTIVGGLITHGSYVDVIALSSVSQNLASENNVRDFKSISISPVLMAVRVLKVQKEERPATKVAPAMTKVSLILELSRKQIAKLVIAKKIAQLEIHKSIGVEQAEQLQANTGDVLPTYRAIKEFRAGDALIK